MSDTIIVSIRYLAGPRLVAMMCRRDNDSQGRIFAGTPVNVGDSSGADRVVARVDDRWFVFAHAAHPNEVEAAYLDGLPPG